MCLLQSIETFQLAASTKSLAGALRICITAVVLTAAAFGSTNIAHAQQLEKKGPSRAAFDPRLFASNRPFDLPLPFGKLDAWTVLDDTFSDANLDAPFTRFVVADRGKARFDTRRFAYERPAIDAAFPNLRGDYEVWRPHTKRYNCIAWSLGIDTQWVWPGESIASFDQLNSRYRYRRLGRFDLSVHRNTEKIVLYAKSENGRFVATHQARQLADGTWTSKLGQLALIRHRTPYAVDNALYGQPVVVYFRAK